MYMKKTLLIPAIQNLIENVHNYHTCMLAQSQNLFYMHQAAIYLFTLHNMNTIGQGISPLS